MYNRSSIRYPRSWTEARRIFKNLDARWDKMLKSSDKRWRAREWASITSEVNKLREAALKESSIINGKLDITKTAYKAALIMKKPKAFSVMMATTIGLNFHNRILRTTNEWMRSKKVPVK